MSPTRKPAPPEDPRRRVLIVDDHPVVRQGLAVVINSATDLFVCGEAENPAQALSLILTLQPDIVLVDLSLGDADGLELIKDIKARHPSLPALVISMHDESVYAERALRAGARGYCTKQQAVTSIAAAIRRVLSGEVHLSEHMITRILRKVAEGDEPKTSGPIDTLSDRELQVLRLIGQGFGTSEISEKLHISVKTVETHREHLKSKLAIGTAAELTRYAIEWAKDF